MLTVLCPDLLLNAAEIAAWPRAVAQRLTRARVLHKTHDDSPIPPLTPPEAWLKRQFSLPPDTALTISAYQRYCYGPIPADLPAGGRLLTATPAYVHATLDHLVLNPASMLTVGKEEASELAQAANEFLAQDGIELRVLAPDCWLLITPDALNIDLHGSLQVSGRNVHAYMPAGPDGRRLRSLLNELQMLWHDHPVNQRRAENGEVPINSLWVEGSVHASDVSASAAFQSVLSDSVITRGLAIGCGVDRVNGLPTPPFRVDPASDTMIELTGPGALDHLGAMLDGARLPVTIVLCDQRSSLELLSTANDKYRFWRGNALSLPLTGQT